MSFAVAVNSSLVSDDHKQVRSLDFPAAIESRLAIRQWAHEPTLTTEATMTIRLPLACIWILEDPTTRSSQLEGIHEGD